MTSRIRDNIQCDWFENPDKQWLAKTWIDLETRSNSSFFLSWLWIGSWLDCFVDDFTVIEARKLGATVGLGIIITKRSPLIKGGRVKHYLHRTGVTQEDQIWIEYNDFLVTSDSADQIRDTMLSSVANRMGKKESLIIGAVDGDKFSNNREFGLEQRKVWETTFYSLDLSKIQNPDRPLLKTLSRNSRYQVTRSLRKYSEIGDLTVTKAGSVDEALALFSQAEPYHVARWGKGKTGSGFVNPKFVAFHKKLIELAIPSGFAELNHIRAGVDTIGIVYNFRYRNAISFYLGAMNYCHESSHYKPGLTSHYLLIEKALKEGLDIYDFMGGTARYKEMFSNIQGELAVYQFDYSRPLLSFEQYARKLKSKLSSNRGIS